MGTWDTDSFDNDDAMDFISELSESEDIEVLREAFEAVVDLPADDYLEAPECHVAIAAAEIVAAMRGAPSAHMPEEVGEFITRVKVRDEELATLAIASVERIRTGSELQELWEESDECADWLEALDELATRLR